MDFVEDELIAWQLQNELHCGVQVQGKENQNPVDSRLEYTDPTPSIHDLFVKFDNKFFWGSLGMVEVSWSRRMTSCAGVCSFQGRRGLCKISLSAPLLSLRPRKNLVETLLHEMIHAYLFITNNYKDRDDHGPEFHKHMHRINKEAGTNITVYHTFHDEVDYYQRHIWRCNGPCRDTKPFYGFVKRAMNRAPGPHDFWWKRHQVECNGVFVKIAEPEKSAKKTGKAKNVGEKCKDIRSYFPSGSSRQHSNVRTLADFSDNKPMGVMRGVKGNGNSQTLVIGKKKPGGFREGKQKSKESKVDPSNSTAGAQEGTSSEKVREVVRNFWSNKFPSNPEVSVTKTAKKLGFQCPVCDRCFSEDKIQSHIEDCSKTSKEAGVADGGNAKECPVCSEKIAESVMSEHLENCLHCSFVSEDEKEGEELEGEVECQSVPCPCCYKWFLESEMNSHLDDCLTLNALKEEILAS